MRVLRNLANKILEHSELVSPFNQAKILFHKEKFNTHVFSFTLGTQ